MKRKYIQKHIIKYKLLGIFVGVLLIFFIFNLFVKNSTSEPAEEQGLNFISEIKGSVKVQYNGKGKYEEIYIGDVLKLSDKLRVPTNGSFEVVCNNLSVWKINSQGEFPVSKGCPSTEKSVLRRDTLTDNTRAPNNSNNPNIPYLISPRNTAILKGKPTLRWNPVSGATSYELQISGEQFNWTTQVGEARVVYSGNQPMQPGIYKVNITANNGACTKDKDDSVLFNVPNKEDIIQVNAYVEQLEQMSLSNTSKTLALVHLYKSYGFNAKAIELLERLVKDGNQTTAVYQVLGSIYQKIGLNDLAKEKYLKAMELAEAQGNLKVQKNIQSQLDRI